MPKTLLPAALLVVVAFCPLAAQQPANARQVHAASQGSPGIGDTARLVRPLVLESLSRAALDSAGERLVTVEGTVARLLARRRDRMLQLETGGDSTWILAVAEVDRDNGVMDLERFRAGDRIRATGILTRRVVRNGTEVQFRILPNSAAALEPLEVTARAKTRLAIAAATILVLALLTSALVHMRGTAAANRRRLEETLRESAERYRLMVERAPVGIVVHRDGRIVFANAEFARLLGAPSADALRGRDVLSVVHPDDRPAEQHRIDRIMAGDGFAVTARRRLVRIDGGSVDAEVTSSDIVFGGELSVQAVVHDVGERRRAELALQESDARFRLAARATNDVVWDWNLATNEVSWGESTFSVFGYLPAELEGPPEKWVDRVHEDDRECIHDSVSAAIAGDGDSWKGEYRFRRKGGSYATVFDRGYILRAPDGRAIRVVGAMQDLTERMHLEARLRHAQKMEAVGQLAAGIAHDFNNLLTVMSTYSELVLADLPLDSPSRADVQEIQRAGQRAVGLTRQLLSFSRRDVVRSDVFDLNVVVHETEKLLRRTIGEQIALEVTLSRDPCRVLADRGQMGQVLMNLMLNARDAMAASGGTLTLETGVYDAARLPRSAAQRATGHRNVLLTVRDTGVGMDDEALSRIFEPFFTTKAPGEGTGLGLATVYGIVTQAGGSAWAESAVGQGSTFYVLLPEVAPGTRSTVDSVMPVRSQRRVTATVLLVEDEGAVRLSVARSLTRQGFVVRQAKNANDALMIWHEARKDIDAVVTDVVMPGLRGPELVALLREDCPALPVLFISGYTDFSLGSTDLKASHTAFLPKPFSVEDLGAQLRSLIESQGSSMMTG